MDGVGKAHYFHASLHRFDKIACATIFEDLHNELKDARVHCEYDDSLDIFYVNSPSDLGLQADEAFCTILQRHIKQATDNDRNSAHDVSCQEKTRRVDAKLIATAAWKFDQSISRKPMYPSGSSR
jgi:hypothetical protein